MLSQSLLTLNSTLVCPRPNTCSIAEVYFSLEILVTSQSFVALHFLVSEIANVSPEVAYCCFARTTLLPNCLHVGIIRVNVFYHLTKFNCSVCVHLLVSEVALLLFYKNYIIY